LAKAEWRRVAPLLAQYGLLTTLDVSALAGYCAAFERWRRAEEELAGLDTLVFQTDKGYMAPRPEVAIADKARRDMASLCKEFGLTPNSRGRMTLPNTREDERDDFEREAQG